MKRQLVRKPSAMTLVFVSSLIVTNTTISTVYADWSSEKLYKGYNQAYGSFPPVDIDQQLSNSTDAANNATEEQPVAVENTTNTTNPTQPAAVATPNYSQPVQQQPGQAAYNQNTYTQGAYNQSRNYYPQYGQRYNRNSRYNGPWNNRSSFTAPWSNNRSGFRGPWDNGQTSFSGPWNNNGSSFSMPWDNNNGSGFRPW